MRISAFLPVTCLMAGCTLQPDRSAPVILAKTFSCWPDTFDVEALGKVARFFSKF
jgi:hypothetical protein